ncbi:MAG: hypothetical protein HCAMLNBO_01707 [Candidatus Brocadia fulgida]|nr:hypothetical protein [Candidatus Brocadia fulgida]
MQIFTTPLTPCSHGDMIATLLHSGIFIIRGLQASPVVHKTSPDEFRHQVQKPTPADSSWLAATDNVQRQFFVKTDMFNRAFTSPHARAYAHSLKAGACRSGRSDYGVMQDKGNLAVGADVEENGWRFQGWYVNGQKPGNDIASHIGGNAGEGCHRGICIRVKKEFPCRCGANIEGFCLIGIFTNSLYLLIQEDMLHRRIAGPDDLIDMLRPYRPF